jgi:hypothetical protein
MFTLSLVELYKNEVKQDDETNAEIDRSEVTSTREEKSEYYTSVYLANEGATHLRPSNRSHKPQGKRGLSKH